jgi:DNA-binding CsgD family transcriptional regulator
MRLPAIRELVANTADPSFAIHDAGRIAAWNRAAEELFGLSAGDAIGRQCNEVVQGVDECGPVCSADCRILAVCQPRQPVGNFDLQVQTCNGMQWCNVSVLFADGETATSHYAIHLFVQNDFRKRLDALVRELVLRNFSVTKMGLPRAQAIAPISFTPAANNRESTLSAREHDVLKQLAMGATTAVVAERLHISRTTVSNHVQHILRQLSSHTRIEAIRRAERWGLL